MGSALCVPLFEATRRAAWGIVEAVEDEPDAPQPVTASLLTALIAALRTVVQKIDAGEYVDDAVNVAHITNQFRHLLVEVQQDHTLAATGQLPTRELEAARLAASRTTGIH